MEAPEEIYVNYRGFGVFDEPCVMKMQASQIEYIRKDAFIEKAEKYLTEKFINDVSVLAGGVVSINFDAAISNFVKYMKGE